MPFGYAGVLRVSSAEALSITGFVADQVLDTRLVVNVGSFDVTIKHQNESSSESNRIICQNGIDLVIPANGCVRLFYDAIVARWRAWA